MTFNIYYYKGLSTGLFLGIALEHGALGKYILIPSLIAMIYFIWKEE